MYPPTVEDVPIRMNYPPWIPAQDKFAIGHEVFGLLPGLGMYATLWLREHNRVCDILKAEHPTWDDEQLFQTARLVVIGEMTALRSRGWTRAAFPVCNTAKNLILNVSFPLNPVDVNFSQLINRTLFL